MKTSSPSRQSEHAAGNTSARLDGNQLSPNIQTESWLKSHSDFRLKKLLVPVDFSEASTKALQYAIALGREFESEIILLHVVQPVLLVAEAPVAMMELETQAEQQAAARLRLLEKCIEERPCRSLVCVGNPAKEIVAEADRQEVDAIVIATHGRIGLARAFMGSVAEHVIRNASCPVLVVREKEREFLVVPPDDPQLNRIADLTNTNQCP